MYMADISPILLAITIYGSTILYKEVGSSAVLFTL